MKITRRQLRQIIKEVITHEINERKDYSGDGFSSRKSQESPGTGSAGDIGDTGDTGDTGIADTGEVNPCLDLSDKEIFDMLKEYPLGDIIGSFHIDRGANLGMFNQGGMLPGIQTFKKATSASYSMLSLKGFLDLKDDMIKKWEKSEDNPKGLSSQESEERWNEILVGDQYLALVDVISWIKDGKVPCPSKV